MGNCLFSWLVFQHLYSFTAYQTTMTPHRYIKIAFILYIWGWCVPIDTAWALGHLSPSNSGPDVFYPLSDLNTCTGMTLKIFTNAIRQAVFKPSAPSYPHDSIYLLSILAWYIVKSHKSSESWLDQCFSLGCVR